MAQRNDAARHRGPDGGMRQMREVVELVAERLKSAIFLFERHGSPLAGYLTKLGNPWDQKWEMSSR